MWLQLWLQSVAESLHRSCSNVETNCPKSVLFPPLFPQPSNHRCLTPWSMSPVPFVNSHLPLHAVQPIRQIPDTCLDVQASGRASISSSEPPPSSNELETETRRLCKLLCIRPNVPIAAYLIPSLSMTSTAKYKISSQVGHWRLVLSYHASFSSSTLSLNQSRPRQQALSYHSFQDAFLHLYPRRHLGLCLCCSRCCSARLSQPQHYRQARSVWPGHFLRW